MDIKTRLDDNVKKGQLLFRVQSADVSTAFDAYLKTVNDEQLANKAYLRAEDLLKHGAISEAMVEQADDAEKNAKADLTAAEEQLKVLGVDKDHPSTVVDVFAPISGVIIGQNVTNAAAAGVTLSGSATAFTIADLSTVWIMCDVYENDIPRLKVGQEARFRLNANAAGAIRAGAAEQSADRTLAAGAGELNVAPRGRRQRGEQALGLLDAMPAGFVRLAVEAVGEPEVRARRLGGAPP